MEPIWSKNKSTALVRDRKGHQVTLAITLALTSPISPFYLYFILSILLKENLSETQCSRFKPFRPSGTNLLQLRPLETDKLARPSSLVFKIRSQYSTWTDCSEYSNKIAFYLIMKLLLLVWFDSSSTGSVSCFFQWGMHRACTKCLLNEWLNCRNKGPCIPLKVTNN